MLTEAIAVTAFGWIPFLLRLCCTLPVQFCVRKGSSLPVGIDITQKMIHDALNLWHQGDTHGSSLQHLLIWKLRHQDGLNNVRQATNQLLLDALAALANEDPTAQRILELRFLREESGQHIANVLHLAEGTIWRKQREAIARLTEIIQAQEEQAQRERTDRFASRLPLLMEATLFGIEHHLAQLAQHVTEDGAPWIIALEGIGGIGKTTLATALIRTLLSDPRWHDIAWVTARQQIFNGGGAIKPIARPALTTEALIDELVEQLLRQEIGTSELTMEQKRAMLQHRLREHPHLIVVDNLETLLDIEALLSTLRAWAGPTKFILTSRVSRFHETDIFHFTVPELCETDALALIRSESQIRNNVAMAAASDEELHPIYETVGGNPLALRLVVGQTHIHGLGHVLADLQQARGHTVEQLYHYIYWHVWENLDELAQQTLLLMPLVTESGGDFEYLAAMASGAGLSAEKMGNALDRLVAQNLVDSQGGLHERRYTIHALTRTFLQKQVLKWGDETFVADPPIAPK